MDYRVSITVHVYGKERLNDCVLKPHSKHYGICGKTMIAPLRKINGREIVIQDVSDNFSVQELWNWIVIEIYANDLDVESNKNIIETSFYNSLEKYLVFDGLRYTVDDVYKPLTDYLQMMNTPVNEKINIQLLVCEDEGDFCKDDGIRYYFQSHESGSHHSPHIHVDIKHDFSGTFSIKTGEQLEGDIKREKYLKQIKNTILSRQREMLEFWNRNTDGLKVDINQFLGIIDY